MKSYSFVFFCGFIFYFITHCLFLSEVPGLHFDEAWAAFFSFQISKMSIPFPLEAMSPYTSPWSHFITALFYKTFSTNLWIDRFSGIVLSAAGVYFISRALLAQGKTRAACIFPWVCAFFLPLILNHRFCIEITTFHVFCIGLLLFGLSAHRYFLIGTAIFFGMTSHILFLAPALATWFTRRLQPEGLTKNEKILILGTCLSLTPFLLKVYFKIPDHEKAIALLLLDFLICIDTIYPRLGDLLFKKCKRLFLGFSILLSIPGFCFLLFFSEGHWNVLFNYGWIKHAEWIGMSWIILIGLCIATGVSELKKLSALPVWFKLFLTWLMFSVLLICLISIKPTSRYYEAGFLSIAVLASLAFGSLPTKKTVFIFSLFALASSIQLWKNYYQVGLHHEGKDRDFSFYIPHDSSGDYLDKQYLVQYLASHSCKLEDVEVGDIRLYEALRFLSIGDWPESQERSCEFGKLIVNRKSQAPQPLAGKQRLAEIGPFVLDQK